MEWDVKVELAIRDRICLYCEKKMPKGTKCVRFPHANRTICMPCFKKSCIKIFGVDAFSTKFKAAIMAEEL